MNFELRGWPQQPPTFSNNTLDFLIAVPGRLINFQNFYGQEGPY